MRKQGASWELRPLGSVATLQRGFDLPVQSRRPGPYPVFAANGPVGFHDEAVSNGPGVVTGRSGSIGKVHLVVGPFWPLNTALWVKDFHGNNPEWVRYLLEWFDLSRFARGAAVPTLDRKLVHSELVPLPPVSEQGRIVARINQCMERVEEIRRLRREALDEGSHLVESLIEVELAELGGEEVVLSDVCEITSRLVDPREPQYQSMLHVGGANIESRTGRLIDLRTAAEEELKSGKFVFDRSVILYNKIRPYLMKVARPDFSGLCSADMYPLTPKANLALREFIYYVLMSRRFTTYAIAGSNRAGMPKVNREHLFAYQFTLPPLETQRRICELLDSAIESVHLLGREMSGAASEMNQVRDSILHQAFAGEL